MTPTISAGRVATLVGQFDRSPAYAGLADALRLLVADGRLPLDARLPSERELTNALGVSRTTVTRAYAALAEAGYAVARQGAGTFTTVPGDRASLRTDRALLPRSSDLGDDDDLIDLGCAAPVPPPGLAQAYEEAVAELPAYFAGHGYYPAGLPVLQEAIAASYDARGLPTAPDQIMVTAGALSGVAVVSRAFTGPGQRVLVESPGYPNAVQALRHHGARVVGSPVDPEGWDLDAIGAALRQHAPTLAYLIPDFQNPTGHLMGDDQRAEYAEHLRRARTVAVVDEAHQALALEGQSMPRPFAAYAAGHHHRRQRQQERVGRAPPRLDPRTARGHGATDLRAGRPRPRCARCSSSSCSRRLLADEQVLEHHRERLREQRDALAAAVTERLPDWRFRVPTGGLALWCELPTDDAMAVAAEAERRGVVVTPGPVFAVGGGLNRYVRIPWTRPVPSSIEAVDRLAAGLGGGASRRPARRADASRVMVA